MIHGKIKTFPFHFKFRNVCVSGKHYPIIPYLRQTGINPIPQHFNVNSLFILYLNHRKFCYGKNGF